MRGDYAANSSTAQRQQRPSTAGATVTDSTMDYSFAFEHDRRYAHTDTSHSDTEVGDSFYDTIDEK